MIKLQSLSNHRSRVRRRLSGPIFLVLLLFVVSMTGCGRQEVRSYTIPNEDPWRLPQGWVESEPGAMQVARFSVPIPGGQQVDVSLIPLRRMPGSRADVVNIWRQQMQLEPLTEEKLAQLAVKIPISRSKTDGDLFELASPEGSSPGELSKARTLLATVKEDETSWFIKMTGESDAVLQAKPGFLSFLTTLNFGTMPEVTPMQRAHGGHAGASPARAEVPRPEWKIPDGWEEQPASRMLLAKFRISAEDGATADVNITSEQGEGGGLLLNLNRWRGQLGLGAVEADQLDSQVTTLDLPSGQARLVEIDGTHFRTGQPALIIAAIVSQQDRTWFYKLMGDKQLAEREKQAFIEFVRTTRYLND